MKKPQSEIYYTQYLKDVGLKVTPIRMAILSILVRHKGPLSCEKLFKKVNSLCGCDLVTIYRNLALFHQTGLIQETHLKSGLRFFEWIPKPITKNQTDQLQNRSQGPSQAEIQSQKYKKNTHHHHNHHHHHVICTSCRKITCLSDSYCSINKYEKGLINLGFKNIEHRLEFFALCRSCQ